LESSKVFAKEFMRRHGIPTAPFTVHSSSREALRMLESSETRYPIVIKADGLAAGKGVVVAHDLEAAREAVDRIMVRREFGVAGDQIVVEECLEGIETSFFVFTDGETLVPTVPAKDHKAVFDGDRGPNTGGMGAYSADGILTPELRETILSIIVEPTIQGMREEGTPFRGILFAGLMLTSEGPQVLEFNVRLGDPECQVVLPRLDSDFAALCEAVATERLRGYKPAWRSNAAVCVVLASGGYPGEYAKGKVLSGIEMALEDPHVVVFHSGTRLEGRSFLTDGGRVLGVTAVAEDLSSAIMSAYDAVNKIRFEGMHYRRDIGALGLQAANC
jgi:phosphoribosylamine--glycine ligase